MSILISTQPELQRVRMNFDADWRFAYFDPANAGALQSEPEGLELAAFDDAAWRGLDLPHDWGVEAPFRLDLPGATGKLPFAGVGWYRKHFRCANSAGPQKYFLDFDGAMSNSRVWLNGHFLGGWPYGYTSFRLELTPHLKFGAENVLAVRLENPPESSRWYPGGGIYRHVWLVRTHSVHIAQWGVSVTPRDVSAAQATLQLRTEVKNSLTESVNISLRHELALLNDPEHIIAREILDEQRLPAGNTTNFAAEIRLDKPQLWDIDDPLLYLSKTAVYSEGEVLDQYETRFGVRNAQFDPASGFLLNGRRVPLNGVCLHHDLGPLGTAVNTRAMERQLELLKELGCNAIRTAHNPPAPELLDLCDQKGFLVIDEAFDTWRVNKTPNDYSRLFDEWHEKDLAAMIRRDRNHPSIILWSSGNEVAEQWRGEEGIRISARLREIIHELDSSRPVTVACQNQDAGNNGFSQTLDVMGYNYKPHKYEEFHAAFPHVPVYGSETSSCVSSRGVYHFPFEPKRNAGFREFQVSSYDWYCPEWATLPDEEFAAHERLPYVAGEFVWTGFDYLGEPTPFNDDPSVLLNLSSAAERAALLEKMRAWGGKSPARSSYFGIFDLCGFPKDRFYLYQSRWRPELPLAHILPHWNWPQRRGEITPVHVYTSGDQAELLLNGKSLGVKQKQHGEFRLIWPGVRYEPGILRVEVRKHGQPWAQAERCTTGTARKILLTPDREKITYDGCDLSFITVRALDENQLPVPDAADLIRFEISGPGKIAAVGNGDSTSHQPFRSSECKLFNGLCQVIVRGMKNQTGAIQLSAKSDRLAPVSILIHDLPAPA